MNDDILNTISPLERELTLTRIFDAPREQLFELWTDPKYLARWWGPKGFTNPVCEVDLQPGGRMLIHMRAPDGTVFPMSATFREIIRPERLVFLSSAIDEDGESVLESLTTVTFAEHGANRTKLTMHAHARGLKPVAERYLDGMQAGWTQSLEKLETCVPKR